MKLGSKRDNTYLPVVNEVSPHSLSAENEEFDYEIRDKLVGLGIRSRYRAIFTIEDDEVFVLAVRAGEQDRLTTDDVDFDAKQVQIAIFSYPGSKLASSHGSYPTLRKAARKASIVSSRGTSAGQ